MMKTLRITAALLLAAAMFTLPGCSSKKKNLTESEAPASEAQQATSDTLSFTTKDIDGNKVTMKTYQDAKVVMFNMWEPWCGPCREELPALQKLYKKYKSEGLMIVGVYSDTDGLRTLISDNKLKYPMIKQCAEFDPFQTGYVPTTFFTDGSGKVLSEESYIGGKSYEEWETIILSYLNQPENDNEEQN